MKPFVLKGPSGSWLESEESMNKHLNVVDHTFLNLERKSSTIHDGKKASFRLTHSIKNNPSAQEIAQYKEALESALFDQPDDYSIDHKDPLNFYKNTDVLVDC